MNGVAENYVEGIQGVPLEWREFSAYSNPLRHSHPARGGRWTMLHSLSTARWFACWLIDEANGGLGNERTRATQDHQVIDTEVGFM